MIYLLTLSDIEFLLLLKLINLVIFSNSVIPSEFSESIPVIRIAKI